jgi:alpha-galactosidase
MTYEAAGYTFAIKDPIEGMEYSFRHEERRDGITDLTVSITAGKAVPPTKTRICWKVPVVDIHYKWNPMSVRHRYLDFEKGCYNKFPTRANGPGPVMALYNMAGTNALTFAIDDALHDNDLSIGLDEHGFLDCSVGLFQAPWDPITEYKCTIRLDQRHIPYYTAVKDVGDWWETLGMKRVQAPEAAIMPFFCTWYSHHGPVTQDDVLLQAQRGKELGIDTMLIDAGWGEPYRISPDFPDLKKTVEQIHDMGMKVLLWTDPSAPNKSNKELFLNERIACEPKGSKRFDPRYPKIRAHWIEEYLHAMDSSGCDGFKIDFLGTIASAAEDEPEDSARDYRSVPEAVDVAMRDIYAALRKKNPDIMIEFRSRYHGPCMLQHCTMMRAVDCGNSYPDNRLRTIDIRLLSGNVPVHADPITWNPDEPVTSAALHMQHTLFAVPQVSVKLETLPKDHIAMLRTYLAFWREHRDVIWQGKLMPLEQQNAFPAVLSQTYNKLLVGIFTNTVVHLPHSLPKQIDIVNATCMEHVVLHSDTDHGAWHVTITSCTGEKLQECEITINCGVTCIDAPPSGYISLSRY